MPDARTVWQQGIIPVVFRPEKGKPLMVRLPGLPGSYADLIWLKGNHVRNPSWDRQHNAWLTPRAWFGEVVYAALTKYGRVYVIQHHREFQKCAPACWNAKGLVCECSCLGEHHGELACGGGWFIISETCALLWGDKKLGCRLLEKLSSSIPAAAAVPAG